MPDTPDRAALAERLDAMKADRERFAARVCELYRTDPECQATQSKISFLHARALAWHKAMQERIALAAPAVPPSVAEAREAYDAVVIGKYETMQGEAGQDDEDAAFARVVAAVRAATVAVPDDVRAAAQRVGAWEYENEDLAILAAFVRELP